MFMANPRVKKRVHGKTQHKALITIQYNTKQYNTITVPSWVLKAFLGLNNSTGITLLSQKLLTEIGPQDPRKKDHNH